MLDQLRKSFSNSELFAFNAVLRDQWVADQATMLKNGARVLDVGAGSAPYRKLFTQCKYQTQDLSPLRDNQLRYGKYAAIDYVCDAMQIPVPDGNFDVILCTEMLEHHPEPIRVVREFARVLAPRGKLLLTAPLGSGIHQEPYHFYGGYTPYWYERFLAEAGFEDIIIEPNAGSFRFFSQESIRFLQSSMPLKLGAPWWVRILWLPMWLIMAPLLGGVIPVVCRVLDRFDHEKRFTVGYHVTAVKKT